MELTDLAKIESEKAETMLKQLEEWERSVAKSLNGKDYH
jgi:hypothetical protein